ncbi:hypothetical protein ACFV30_40530 [Streptomyces sp. NPDC059752]|uniref:hypothetical protein n=1 Tax=Streptomyces sp. NPDC059752 TaxID=3346932 RepID=UPI0036468A72
MLAARRPPPAARRPPPAARRPPPAARRNTIARFLPGLLGTFTFEASPAGEPVLDAIDFVKYLKGRRRPIQAWEVSAKVLTSAWRRLVFPPPAHARGAAWRSAR